VFRGICDAPGGDGAVGGCTWLMRAPPSQAIGKVQAATGLVTVMGASGVVAQVQVGDPVYRHDTIETGADGAVGITFTDGTAFNLSNDARMVLNEFVCDGTSSSALFSLSKGAFAFIAGKVAKAGQDRYPFRKDQRCRARWRDRHPDAGRASVLQLTRSPGCEPVRCLLG